MIDLLYTYIATFVRVENGIPIYKQVAEKFDHPFRWMATQKAVHQLNWTIVFWQEITEDEYEFFYHHKLHHPSTHGG